MSTQRVSNIKIPMFDKVNYNLWKRKMLLFLRTANTGYDNILKNGISIPLKIVHEHMEDGILIPHQAVVKDPSEYTDEERELVSLDTSLQLILVEFLDPIMYNHVVNCESAKQIWDTIEILNEGTEEVRENRLEILTSQYEHFNHYQAKVSHMFLRNTTN